MLIATENKSLTSDDNALIRALLESPLAEDLRRSMNFQAKAIRDWAAVTAPKALTSNRRPIVTRLTKLAKESREQFERG